MPLASTSSKLYRAQRRRMRPKYFFSWLRLFLKGLGIAGAMAASFWLLSLVWPLLLQIDYFHIRTVDIVGTQTVNSQEVRYLLGIAEDTSLLELDLPRIGDRLARHPLISRVTLRRKLPDKVIVTIQEHTPYFMVRAEEQPMVIDASGAVLRAFEADFDAHLPELVLPLSYALLPGRHLPQRESQRAVALAESFKASPLGQTARLASLTLQPSGASMWRVDPYPFPIYFGEGDIETQLSRLPLVLHYIAQQGLAVRSIDLSYRRRIIITPAS